MDNIRPSDALAEVLLKHFGVRDAKDLVLCPLTLDIKSLAVLYENISAPFKMTHYTHIQAVSTVDGTVLLWMGHALPLHFRTQEFGFDAHLTCGKIFYDIHGFQLIFEGLDVARKLRIHPVHKVTVTVDTKNPR